MKKLCFRFFGLNEKTGMYKLESEGQEKLFDDLCTQFRKEMDSLVSIYIKIIIKRCYDADSQIKYN